MNLDDHQSSDKSVQEIYESYWVVPGRLIAGEYPGAIDPGQAHAKARWLLGIGVTYCLNLTEPNEYGLIPYQPVFEEEAAQLGKQIIHKRLSIPDLGTPSKAEMIKILDTGIKGL